MADSAPRPADPSPRVDARRNRARVLEAAQEAFAADGLAVPLDDIARRAGVGPGTVYRHFPSKAVLFEAVVQARIEQLIEAARALATADDPGEAFFAFFVRAVERASLNRALCEALAADLGSHFQAAPDVQSRYLEALGVLLTRAQDEGAVRADVGVSDVRDLMVGCMTTGQLRDGPPARVTAIVCDGLRPGGPRAPLPLPVVTTVGEPVVTKPGAVSGDRNETSSAERNETGHNASRCEVCGGPIRAARTGRPPRFCGPACRQKAHRRRARAGSGA